MFLKQKVILKGHLYKEKIVQITWYPINKETGHGNRGWGMGQWCGLDELRVQWPFTSLLQLDLPSFTSFHFFPSQYLACSLG